MDLTYNTDYEWYSDLFNLFKQINIIMRDIVSYPPLAGTPDSEGNIHAMGCLANENAERLYSYILNDPPSIDDPNGRIVLMRHPEDKSKIYIIQLRGGATILDSDPIKVNHPERLTPESIPYNDPIVLHVREPLTVLADRLELAHSRHADDGDFLGAGGTFYGPLVFHGMAGHYIEEDLDRYMEGSQVSELEPLASTMYGVADVRLIELIDPKIGLSEGEEPNTASHLLGLPEPSDVELDPDGPLIRTIW